MVFSFLCPLIFFLIINFSVISDVFAQQVSKDEAVIAAGGNDLSLRSPSMI
jgi:hypothetical protein